MPLTENQRIKLHLAISSGFSNKDDWNKFFKDERLELRIDFSNYPIKNDLDKIQCQYQQNSQNREIKILIFEAPHVDLCLNKEYETIISSINSSNHGNPFKIIRKRVISADEISQELANNKPDIVHFSGHGLEDGSFSLGKETVKPKFLESKLNYYKETIKCVIFNTCHSEKIADIISPYINYVISMNNSIIDDKAIHFAKSFYSGLVQAYSDGIDIFLTGFVEGIIALTNDDYSQELVPVLKIGYKQAILNFIKKKDAESKIDDFIKKLIPQLSTNKLFCEFHCDYSYPIKEPDLDRLIKIVNKIDCNLVTRAYRETLPENATVDNSELNNPKNIDNIIDILRKDYPEIGNNPSILEFAKNLARKFTENSQEYKTIKSWVEEISLKLNIQISVQPKNGFIFQEIYTYLLVIVDDKDNRFNLRAEYILEDESLNKLRQEPFNLPGHNEQTGIICDCFNEIPDKVKQYYDELFLKLEPNELKKITIELFLPINYLTKNLDKEWVIDDNTLGKSLMVRELNIVVRPTERLNPKFRIPLKNNFDRFKHSFNKYSDEDILNKEIEIIKQKVFDGNYQKISDNFKDKKIGVKLTYNGIPDKAFFQAIIRGATVIAFWNWKICSIPENSNFSDIDYFKLEYFKNDFRNLSEKMHELRKAASYNDQNENFYHLGFLCDNPNRIPNIKPLKSF